MNMKMYKNSGFSPILKSLLRWGNLFVFVFLKPISFHPFPSHKILPVNQGGYILVRVSFFGMGFANKKWREPDKRKQAIAPNKLIWFHKSLSFE
jgi:hypothetical protein